MRTATCPGLVLNYVTPSLFRETIPLKRVRIPYELDRIVTATSVEIVLPLAFCMSFRLDAKTRSVMRLRGLSME